MTEGYRGFKADGEVECGVLKEKEVFKRRLKCVGVLRVGREYMGRS